MTTAAALLDLAFKHHQAGQPAEAERLCRLVLQAQPAHADCWSLLGVVCHAQAKAAPAEASLRHAVALLPHKASFHNLLGAVLIWQNRLGEATACFEQALRCDPVNADAWTYLGSACDLEGQPEAAVARYQRAVELRPDHVTAHCNLGIVLDKLGRPLEAIGHLRQALDGNAHQIEALNSLANALRNVLRLDEAMACIERALQLQPDYAPAHFNRAALWLLQGDFQRGWPEYEWRWQLPDFAMSPLGRPMWDGAPLHGRSILLCAEQGYGDTFQFVRYARLVKERGGRVLVGSKAPVARLLASVPGIDALVVEGEPLPMFDVQAPLASLPGIFQTTLPSVPAEVPYLHVEAALIQRWRDLLAPKAALRIGICWQGNPKLREDRKRSIPLVHFERLGRLHGVELISLQKGAGTDQLRALAGRFAVRDVASLLGGVDESFLNIAAVMLNVDLVISCDSALAHLAGALGVPVWLALPAVADWRWLLERQDSPWYPTMRLFRQKRWGDWEDVFERMAMELVTGNAVP